MSTDTKLNEIAIVCPDCGGWLFTKEPRNLWKYCKTCDGNVMVRIEASQYEIYGQDIRLSQLRNYHRNKIKT